VSGHLAARLALAMVTLGVLAVGWRYGGIADLSDFVLPAVLGGLALAASLIVWRAESAGT
jgi:hypothetical protein